jgi:hypothetical protein
MRVRLLKSFGGYPAWKDIDMPAPPTPGLLIDLGKNAFHETVDTVTFSVEESVYRVNCLQPADDVTWDRSPDPFTYLARVEVVKQAGWKIAREDLVRSDIAQVFEAAGKSVPVESAFMAAGKDDP